MHRFILPAFAALLLLASCNRSESGSDRPQVEFIAVHGQEGSTRTYLDGNKVLWSADDSFALMSGSLKELFSIKPEDAGKSEAVFAGGDPGAGPYVAIYPADIAGSLSNDGTAGLTLPQEQNYSADGTFADGANPMIAVSNTRRLPFMNLCGMLVLQVCGNATITSIELESSSGEALWGEAEVATGYSEAPELKMTAPKDAAHSVLTLDCGNGIKLGDESISFCFVLPAGTLAEGFTARIRDAEGAVMEITTEKDITIKRSCVSRMASVEFLPEFSAFLSEDDFGVYELSDAAVSKLFTYSRESDQLALRRSASDAVFRIQSLVNARALCFTAPADLTEGGTVQLVINTIGTLPLQDGTVSATVLRIRDGKVWLEDKENKRGYIIASEL